MSGMSGRLARCDRRWPTPAHLSPLLRPALVTVLMSAPVRAAPAQEPTRPDSTAVAVLEELVVTADRAESSIGTAVSAVTRVPVRDLTSVAYAGVPEALRHVPGYSLVDFDGSGLDPQMMVRGFYGGGETEYVVVLLDGRPLNDVQSGVMAWELVPPVEIEAIEVVRGSSSALYGDAAVGGVINLISASGAQPGGGVQLVAAGQGLLRGGIRTTGRVAGRPLRFFGAGLRSGGFREHGQRNTATAGASMDLVAGEGRRLTASVRSSWRELEHPGPLPEASLEVSRTQASSFYRFDETNVWAHAISLEGYTRGETVGLSAGLTSEVRRSNTVRTLPLTPDFADTKERELGTDRIAGNLQAEWTDFGLPSGSRFILGVDASTSRIDSDYFAVLNGPVGAYQSASMERGPIDASGEGRRQVGAGFAQLELRPMPSLRISMGVRYDRLSDRYEPSSPSVEKSTDASHSALSPKAGLNLRWIETPSSTGSLYLTVGRSFKAPTPDQLFDQRSIPLPFPPYSVTTSNASLVPQRGTNVEAGAYHGVSIAGGSVAAAASVSAYQMDMEDELDFDLATLSYINIGESRHRGVEAGLQLSGRGGNKAFFSYALQDATSRIGANAGLSLKAIPRHTWSAGLNAVLGPSLEAGVDVSRAQGAWLDDVNTLRLPAYDRVDLRLSWILLRGKVYVEARNVFHSTYSTTGFLDPSGSGTAYYYPAAGRTLTVGLAFDW